MVNVEPGVEVSASASADEGAGGPTEEEASAATTGAEDPDMETMAADMGMEMAMMEENAEEVEE